MGRLEQGAVPRRVCILRLSALGDCANVVPAIRTLQAARPDIEISWIINKAEAGLVADIPGVECLIYDKRGGRAAIADLKRQLAGRRFDALLDMHASWRANRISLLVKADRRIGFDARRARDGQRLFVRERIPAVESRHVVDGFLAFADMLGASDPVMDWRVPIADADRARAAELLGDESREILFISPRSSHTRRNWLADRYAAAADHAVREHGLRAVLVGGPSDLERRIGSVIENASKPGERSNAQSRSVSDRHSSGPIFSMPMAVVAQSLVVPSPSLLKQLTSSQLPQAERTTSIMAFFSVPICTACSTGAESRLPTTYGYTFTTPSPMLSTGSCTAEHSTGPCTERKRLSRRT